jgi:hypothetical protein
VVADRHGAQWRAAARVAVRDSRVLVGELRVFPDTGDVQAGREGEWSRDVAAIPPHGLEARTLRPIRLGSMPAFVMAFVSRDARDPSENWRKIARVMNRFMLPGAETLERPRPRSGTGRDDRFYARVAADYLDAIAAGERHPVKALAARRGETSARVRDWVHEARVRGLLSPADKQGVKGGWLLPTALALLTRPGAGTPTKPPAARGSRAPRRPPPRPTTRTRHR